LGIVFLLLFLAPIPSYTKDSTAVIVPEEIDYFDLDSGQIDLEGMNLRRKHQPSGMLPELEYNRPKVGLALSGGGARGLAHIGVLQVLSEQNIPIDVIVGTSMGAVVGGLYATGYSPTWMQRITEKLNWGALFSDAPSRRNLFLAQKENANRELLTIRLRNGKPYIPDALVSGQTLFNEVLNLTVNAPYSPNGKPFSSTKIDLGMVATDLKKGERVLLTEGGLPLALRATMAVPIVFRAMRWGDRLLVDGGAMENVPVRATYELGADIVIAVDCATPTTPELDPDSPWEIANQVTTLMSAANDSISRSLATEILVPDLVGLGSTDFNTIRKIIQAGREVTEANIEKIKSITPEIIEPPDLVINVKGLELAFDHPIKREWLPEDIGLTTGKRTTRDLNRGLERLLRAFKLWGYGATSIQSDITPEGILRINVDLGIVRNIRIEGIDEKMISMALREIKVDESQPLIINELQKSIKSLHATGRYSTVYCYFEQQEDYGIDLVFLLEEAPMPRFALGMGFDSDRRTRYLGEVAFPNPLIHLGKEVIVRARYGEYDRSYSLNFRADRLARTYIGWRGKLEYNDIDIPIYNVKGQRIRFADEWNSNAQLDALFNLSTFGSLSAGYNISRVTDLIDGNDRYSAYQSLMIRGTIDTEDRRPFPRSGTFIDFSYNVYWNLYKELSFNTISVELEEVIPIYSRLVGRLNFFSGIAEVTTPSTHRYVIGGITDFTALRTYRFLALRKLSGTAELRYDLISRMIADTYILFRYDLAAFSDQKDWRPQRNDLIQSYAVGMAMDTFLGPMELWGAFSPKSKNGPETKRIVVNLGYRF